MEKIGFGPRLVAYIIDVVIVLVVYFVLVLIGGILGDPIATLVALLAFVIDVVYFPYFWMTSGQTPGKKMMGIKVVATDGSKLTLGKAILRLVGYLISGMILYLGFIWILFDTNKQGWHDKIAGTYVVKA